VGGKNFKEIFADFYRFFAILSLFFEYFPKIKIKN